MSLKIWFPFSISENTPINQGILNGELIWTTAPVVTQGGKNGGGLTTGGCKMSAEQTAQILNNDEFSFCCWIYIISETGTEAPASTGDGRWC